MKKYFIPLVIITASLSFFGAGCGPQGTTTKNSPTAPSSNRGQITDTTSTPSPEDQLAVFQAERICADAINEKWGARQGSRHIWVPVKSHWNKRLGICFGYLTMMFFDHNGTPYETDIIVDDLDENNYTFSQQYSPETTRRKTSWSIKFKPVTGDEWYKYNALLMSE